MNSFRIRRSLITALLLASGTPAFAQVANQPVAPRLSGFSVVMVEGALNPAVVLPPDGIPPAAAKALADLREFLPYKSFRLLDTQWILGSGKLTSRLRGPSGEHYELLLAAYQQGQQGGPQPLTREVAVQQFQLTRGGGLFMTAPQQGSPKQSQGSYPMIMPTGAGFGQVPGASGPMINTSFRMEVGETVVVGTSHLQGDKALIVLLTAVAR